MHSAEELFHDAALYKSSANPTNTDTGTVTDSLLDNSPINQLTVSQVTDWSMELVDWITHGLMNSARANL